MHNSCCHTTKGTGCETMLRLRGHHLICRLGFRGLGYDHTFIENMSAIIQHLTCHPEVKIHVTDTPDLVWAACPHLINGHCHSSGSPVSETRVQQMDRTVMNVLHIESGHIVTLCEIDDKIRLYFDETAFSSVCKGCKWHCLGACEKGLNQLKNRP